MASQTQLKIELEREEDGRWIGEIPALPGVMAYGVTRAHALTAVQALALRVLADRLENKRVLCRRVSQWSATQATRVLAALLRIGWRIKLSLDLSLNLFLSLHL